jgi:hypothetical protein
MKKRSIIVLLFGLLLTLNVSAQDNQKFSPEKFEADMQAFITREAHFTQQESDAYFPLLKEMQTKQRELYAKIRSLGMNRPSDEKGFADAIRQGDKLNIELRQIEQKYHQKMLQVVPASKVYDAIRAENRFHRQMMKGWQKPGSWKNPGSWKKPGNWQKPNQQTDKKH